MNQTLVTEAANENGVIDVTKPTVDVDLSINIRQDDLRMFEDDHGRLLLRTGDMDDGVFLEPVPTPEGVTTDVVVGVDASDFTELEPAEPFTPDVDDSRTTLEVRVD